MKTKAAATSEIEVLIVGAGPTGLFAAALLHRCGVSVRLIDRSEQQAHETRAFVLHARSLELFQSIGLVDELFRHGTIAPGIQAVIDGRVAAELNLDDLGTTDTPYSFLFMLPQCDLERILIEDLARLGVTVEHRTEALAFWQDDDAVRVTVRGPKGSQREIRARYLIGADGAHSLVRKELGLSFEGGTYEQTFLLADCAIDWPFDYEHLKLFLNGRALGLYFPLKGAPLGRIMAIQPHAISQDTAAAREATTATDVSLEEVHAAFNKAAGINVKLSNPLWTSRYRIHHRGVNKYSVGRAFLAGDSAHIHSPVGGQGMNTGLQDAANLAWKLAAVMQGTAPATLLDTYHTERWPVGQKLLAYTDRLFSAVTSQKLWSTTLRNHLAPLVFRQLAQSRAARARAFHFVSQLGIRYHPSAFVRDDLSGRTMPKGLSAGHRAPNAIIARNHDVFSLTQGYRFHVLALSHKPMSKGEISHALAELARLPKPFDSTHLITRSLMGHDPRIQQAESAQVFENYGLSRETPQGLFLIRPDGYIAYRSDRLDVPGFEKFLSVFGQPRKG